MRSRFTIVPVLHPLKADFVHILLATAKRVAPETDMDSANGQVIEASNLFLRKGLIQDIYGWHYQMLCTYMAR